MENYKCNLCGKEVEISSEKGDVLTMVNFGMNEEKACIICVGEEKGMFFDVGYNTWRKKREIMERFEVVGQYYTDRQGDRNRGLSEGMLPMTFIPHGAAIFDTREEAEIFVLKTFPKPEKIREYHVINKI